MTAPERIMRGLAAYVRATKLDHSLGLEPPIDKDSAAAEQLLGVIASEVTARLTSALPSRQTLAMCIPRGVLR